jgi:Bacteriocin-protection, YdeI or OmpD-Associated/Domain of unknown function (DUF1905)
LRNGKSVKRERFYAAIEVRGINPYVHVECETTNRLKAGWRRPMPVLVRVNGRPKKPWRVNLMPRGDGSFYLYLHGSVRKVSGTKVGDRVMVELSFDDSYRAGAGYAMPSWFGAALRTNRRAKEAWNALIPSRKKDILRYFATLKSPEARARNLRRAMEVLSGSQARFMARTWKGGK